MNVPCTFDFNVAATKYFEGLAGGEIPLLMLFSGNVFYASPGKSVAGRAYFVGPGSALQGAGEVWREMMAIYYPNTRLDQPASGCIRPHSIGTRLRMDTHVGTGSRTFASQRNTKTAGAIVNLERWRNRRRCPLRGIHAVSLSSLVGKKPAAVELRRSLPARLLRTTRAPNRRACRPNAYSDIPSTRLTVRVRFLQIVQRTIADELSQHSNEGLRAEQD